MGSEETNSLHRDLGRMEAKLDGLINAVAEQDRKTDMHRKQLYERTDKVALDVSVLTGRVDALRQDVDAIKPVTRDYENLKQRGMAYWGLILLFGGVVAAVIVGLVNRGLDWGIEKLV